MEYQSTIEMARMPCEKAKGRTLSHTMRVLHRDIGFLMIAFNPEKQGLHDKIAKTRVLKVR